MLKKHVETEGTVLHFEELCIFCLKKVLYNLEYVYFYYDA